MKNVAKYNNKRMKDLKGHLDLDMINEEVALKCFQSPNKNIHDMVKNCQLVLKYGKEILQIELY